MIAPLTFDLYPVRVRPMSGESLMGYLWRFYASNGHEVPQGVARLAADVRGGRCRPVEFRWAWPGIGREAIDELLTSEAGADAAIRRRSRLSWSRWPRTSRFCTSCVREGAPHALVLDLPLVEACPTHGTRLLHVCTGCKTSLRWATLRQGWRCACGRSLAETATVEAPHWAQRLACRMEGALRHSSLEEAYGSLEWARELRHRLAHGDRFACAVSVAEQAPAAWLRAIGRWEARLLEQSAEVLVLRVRRLLRRLFRAATNTVIALTTNAHAAGLLDFLSRMPAYVRVRHPAIMAAWVEVLCRQQFSDATPMLLFHPSMSGRERRRTEDALRSWWSTSWPFGGPGLAPYLRAADLWNFEPKEPLIAQALNAFIRVATGSASAVGASSLAACWKPHSELANAGYSVRRLARAFSRLHPAELGFIVALAEQDRGRGDCDGR